MENPFELLNKRLTTIEAMLIEIQVALKVNDKTDYSSIKIADLDLKGRTLKVLEQLEIKNIGDVEKYMKEFGASGLYRQPNCGRIAVTQIVELCHKYNIKL